MPKSKNNIYLSVKNRNYSLAKVIAEDQVLEVNDCYVIDSPDMLVNIDLRIVLKDKAKFLGDILLKVHKGAYNSEAYLSIKCLLLSDTAYANVVPSLEINENDIKAGHAATLSYLESTELEYLMSRGLSEKQAEDVMVQAFLNLSNSMV